MVAIVGSWRLREANATVDAMAAIDSVANTAAEAATVAAVVNTAIANTTNSAIGFGSPVQTDSIAIHMN
jgi:hypothetical protein